jgi:hypothetical protein
MSKTAITLGKASCNALREGNSVNVSAEIPHSAAASGRVSTSSSSPSKSSASSRSRQSSLSLFTVFSCSLAPNYYL